MRLLSLCALVLSVGCFGTSTGNPFDPIEAGPDAAFFDSAPGFDGGVASDAAASDASASDGGAPSDAASDADDGGLCTEAPLVCGVEPAVGCDCLAGETVDLVTLDPAAPQRAVALVDNGAGALIVNEQACTSCEGGFRLDAILIDEAGATTTVPIAEAAGGQAAAARAGDALRLVWLSEGALWSGELGLADGALAAPAESIHTPAVTIAQLDIALSGETLAIAYLGPASGDTADGDAVYVLVPSDVDPVPVQVVSGALRSMSIAAAAGGWMLLYADDDAVYSQRLGPEATLVGEAERVASSASVEALELLASGSGFVAGFDGTDAALHVLDETGASTTQLPFIGTLEALALDGDSVMLVIREAAPCVEGAPSLLYRRFDAALSPLHETILVGEGERGAQVGRLGEGHRVVFTRTPALAIAEVCVPVPAL